MTQKITFRAQTLFDNTPCEVVVEITTKVSEKPLRDWDTLEYVENRELLSISGHIYTGKTFRRLESCGQIINSFAPVTPAQCKLCRFWDKYHLNDLQSGTKAQTFIVNEYCLNNRYDYNKVCEHLIELDLYEDRGYKYGHGWLSKEFPKDELLTIIQELENESK